MRYISKIRKKKFNERISFDKILQLLFNYHFFFFQSLIFRGLKLRAFSLFVDIKSGLKTHDFLAVIDKSKKKEKEEDEEKKKALLNFLAKIFSYDYFLLTIEEKKKKADFFFL